MPRERPKCVAKRGEKSFSEFRSALSNEGVWWPRPTETSYVEFFNYFLHPSRVLLSCQNVSQDIVIVYECMLMRLCALRCYCIQGQHVSTILCTIILEVMLMKTL